MMGMEITVLHIGECPNWREAGARLRNVLDEAGLRDVAVGYRLLTTSDEAARVPFAGSPTILVNGVDAFPTDGRTTDLACRVYLTETGFAGLPSVAQLQRMIAGATTTS